MIPRLRELSDNVKRHGLVSALANIGIRMLNRVVFFKVLRCLKIEAADPLYLTCDHRYSGRFLTNRALRPFTGPEYELGDGFLEGAAHKRDACYGFFGEDDVLASYSWFSTRPTETCWPRLRIEFNPRYIYMYKGYTHTRHRGRRLHAVGMTRALESYLARGYKGFVSYVEASNFSSLKSCYRMGYVNFGTIVALRVFNRYFLYANKGCRRYGFRLVEREAGDRQAAIVAPSPGE